MKRVTFAGGSLLTGNTAARALLDFAAKAISGNTGVTVELPALDENGSVSIHSLLVGPGIQIQLADVDGDASEAEEDARFPVPQFPDLDPVAVVNPTP